MPPKEKPSSEVLYPESVNKSVVELFNDVNKVLSVLLKLGFA